MAEVVVDAPRMPLAPVDPDAHIPESVKRRAAAVDAYYAAQGQTPLSSPEPSPSSPSEAPAPQAPSEPPVSSSAPADESAAAAPPPDAAAAPPEPEAPATVPVDWERNYRAMKGQREAIEGRYKDAQQQIKQMEEQLAQMGEELLQVQQPARQPANFAPPPPQPQQFLTQQDIQNYGTDLIDFTQRAAIQATQPRFQYLQSENEELRKRLAYEARQRLDAQVATMVPNYMEVDRNPRWHQWLRLPDYYTGRIRQQLLNEAITDASAPRVAALFNGFLNEERATGNMETPAAPQPQPALREPVVPLNSLAAPGRARPASGGDASMPTDKPIYTRAQVARLYEQHRKGAYVGREAEWNRIENDFYLAQREGRFRT